MRRFAKRLGVLVLVLVAVDQAVLYLALADGTFQGRRIAPFDPPLFSPSQKESLEHLRAIAAGEADTGRDIAFDGELGWTVAAGAHAGLFEYDELGARRGERTFPGEAVPGVRRVAAIGCSFTRGDEVEAHETWSALIDADDAFAVANFGVGAYGLDQVLLRYRRDVEPLGLDEVWIGVLPAALPRLVSMYRPARRHWDGSIGFKPRFVERDGALDLIPSPATDPAALVRLVTHQRSFLEATEHDFFVARARAAFAPTGTRVAHRFALGRLALTVLEHVRPTDEALVRDTSTGIASLARALLTELVSEIEAAGARALVIVLPCQRDLRSAAAGDRYWSAIESSLAAPHRWIDLSVALAPATEDSSYWRPGGHLSPAGNRVVADALRSQMR